MAKLIFGCGYLGLRVARLWLGSGHAVVAVTRTSQRASELRAEGIEPILTDHLDRTEVALPQGITTVLFAVGNDRTATSIHDLFVGGLSKAVEAIQGPIERFIYISSTGVYGQITGETVDEESPTNPQREGGCASLAGEQLLAQSRLGKQAIVLRLAGLYGPGRVPRAADLIAGRPIDAPAHGWLNLIHVDDAARIVLLADQQAVPPRTYVVADGCPVQRAEYYRELARLLDAPPPTFIEAASDLPAAQRATADKRVDPKRMFADLRPQLMYPTYREGLTAIVRSERRVS